VSGKTKCASVGFARIISGTWLLPFDESACNLKDVRTLWLLAPALVIISAPAWADAPSRLAHASLIQRAALRLTVPARVRLDVGMGATESMPQPFRVPELKLAPLMLSSDVIAVAAASGSSGEAAASGAARPKPASDCNITCGYRSLLGYLVITRDLEIVPSMAVRLFPTSRALAGDSSPIVVRPRVEGAGSSWNGFDVAALF
jgi:hypothetical protein